MPTNRPHESSSGHLYFCTQPKLNEFKCKVEYKPPTKNVAINYMVDDYYYDWGLVTEISIPEQNLTTHITWKRLKDFKNEFKHCFAENK